MTYDIFISHSSYDIEWAEKLTNDLTTKGLSVFLDSERLIVGDYWEKQLTDVLHESRHLVVLYSTRARNSDWVRREIAHFDYRRTGRMIFVLMDHDERAYASRQMISELKDADLYDGGPENVDLDIWVNIVNKIADAALPDDKARRISLVILTTTAARLANMDFNQKPPLGFGEGFDTLIKELDINSKADLLTCYREKRVEWRPFGRTTSIFVILTSILDEANRFFGPATFRFNIVDEDFWSDDLQKVRERIEQIASDLSIIVIDPLALYDPQVFVRVNLLNAALITNKTAVMLVAPFSKSPKHVCLRNHISGVGLSITPYFYEPWRFKGQYSAYCETHVDDENEVKRFLLTTLASTFAPTDKDTIPSYLKLTGG